MWEVWSPNPASPGELPLLLLTVMQLLILLLLLLLLLVRCRAWLSHSY